MHFSPRLSKLIPLFLAGIISLGHSQSYLSANLGATASKSIVGISYLNGKNEFNAGLKGLSVDQSKDRSFQPGVTYIRKVTDNGFYGSFTYAPIFVRMDGCCRLKGHRPTLVGDRQDWKKGWNAGEVFLGGGKDFQWTTWGISLDANLITPANSDFTRSLTFWIGAGASYRFKLD